MRRRLSSFIVVAVTAFFAWAASAAAATPLPPAFAGVTLGTPWALAGQVDRLAHAGVSAVRFPLNWASMQPSRYTEDWTKSDEVVGLLASRGIEAIPVLYSAPAWATSRTVLGIPVDHRPPSTAPVMLEDAPDAEADWSSWVHDAVARYGPGGTFWSSVYPLHFPGARPRPVHVWQVWNEPNLDYFFQPKPSPVRYAELVRISDAAITSVDPRATVALAGMPGDVKFPGYRFLAQLYRVRGFRGEFDLAAAHPYGWNLRKVRRQLDRYRAVMRRAGDRTKRLWVSEFSWGSARHDSQLNRGRAGQARMLVHTLRLLAAGRHRWRLSGASWYDLQDPPHPRQTVGCAWCASAGLFDSRGNPKPSWHAFRRLVG
jgi:polysaccharide biosynthesis protein PslG